MLFRSSAFSFAGLSPSSFQVQPLLGLSDTLKTEGTDPGLSLHEPPRPRSFSPALLRSPASLKPTSTEMDHLPPLFPTLAGALVVYVLWVHSVRYNRINNLHSTYAARYNLTTPPPLHRTNGKAPTRAGLPMTPAEAQKILQMGLTSDLPFLGAKALEFALFKVGHRATRLTSC